LKHIRPMDEWNYGQDSSYYYYKGKNYLFGVNTDCSSWGCLSVVLTFFPLFLFHVWMMIYPLNWWCQGNQLLIGYTFYTFIQMFISYLYALESPLFRAWNTAMRWVIIAPSMLTGTIWLIQVITLCIKLLISGDIWKEFEDVIAAYLIVMGIPHAIFVFYNFGRH